jgi:hypothetical protein
VEAQGERNGGDFGIYDFLRRLEVACSYGPYSLPEGDEPTSTCGTGREEAERQNMRSIGRKATVQE